MGLGATGVFDTHPSQGDRIRCARRAAEPGVFHLDGPARSLFAHFDIPAKQVTLLHYTDDLGIPAIAAKLVPEDTSPTAPEDSAVAPDLTEPSQTAGPKPGVRLRRPA